MKMNGRGRMIPSVEERSIRNCNVCAFYVRHGVGKHGYWAMTCSIRQFLDDYGYTDRKKNLCKYNYTPTELKELINFNMCK